MDVRTEMTFPAGVDRVVVLLADPDYVRERSERAHGTNVTVQVETGEAGGFVVTSERDLPTDGLPAMAKSFVGGGLRIRQIDAWAPAADGTWVGSQVVEVLKAPATLSATSTLAPEGETTRQVIEGSIVASVPLFGKKLEELMRTQVLSALAEEQVVAAEWLAR